MATVLTIPTYDGSGQAVHPDVIKVGSTYWMAVTPYPGSDNQYENPSILSSSDGETWTVPDGLTNPVVATPADGYNSDAELVHDGSTFWLFWRENTPASTATTERIYVRSSSDGVTWGSATLLLSGSSKSEHLSPAVTFDGTTWRMWVIDGAGNPNEMHLRTASAATGPWSSPTTCTIPVPSGDDLWHVNVVAYRSGYIALVNYCDVNVSGNNAYLGHAISNDGITWSSIAGTIEPTGSVERVYRGAILLDADGWRTWYSQRTDSNVWQVLLTEDEPLPGALSAVAGRPSAWPSFRP